MISRIEEEEKNLLQRRRLINTQELKKFHISFYFRLGLTALLITLISLITFRNGRLEKNLVSRNHEVLQLNKELTGKEQKFRGLIENSNDVILLTDVTLNFLYCGPSFQRILGWEEVEITGFRLMDLVHPDDIKNFQTSFQHLLLTSKKKTEVLFCIKNKENNYLWLQGVFANLLDEPTLNGILFNLQDVTARKEAEAQTIRTEKIYKTIASAIPGALICLVDTDYRFFLIEGDLLEKVGYVKEQLLGKTIQEAMKSDRIDLAVNLWRRTFEGETFTFETSYENLDMMTRFIPLKGADNSVFAGMAVGTDITELKNTQRELAELNAKLEKKVDERTNQLAQANNELEAFSYSVSHDLRAPLRAIHGYSKIIEEDFREALNDEGKRLLNEVQKNAKRMGVLIDDLLSFSQLGRKEITKTKIDMNDLTRHVADELLEQEKTNARLIIQALHPVAADNASMKQVLVNLISNALKYSSKKQQPCVEINSYIQENEIVYAVKDNGVGFDSQYAHKLFGVFQRLHSAEEYAGTGVGLAIVQRIIHKHGGRVWAEGKPGEGACFYFSLPHTK